MAEGIEVVQMRLENKTQLNCSIGSLMEARGYLPFDYDKLELGFELPDGWPADSEDSPLLSQLTVLAYKLSARIVITHIELVPFEQAAKPQPTEDVRLCDCGCGCKATIQVAGRWWHTYKHYDQHVNKPVCNTK